MGEALEFLVPGIGYLRQAAHFLRLSRDPVRGRRYNAASGKHWSGDPGRHVAPNGLEFLARCRKRLARTGKAIGEGRRIQPKNNAQRADNSRCHISPNVFDFSANRQPPPGDGQGSSPWLVAWAHRSPD